VVGILLFGFSGMIWVFGAVRFMYYIVFCLGVGFV
jgi:hypothetical protein